jgi:adenine phosphoribosyltransferase
MGLDAGWIRDHVRDLADYPKPGVVFKDITPVLARPDAFAAAVDAVVEPFIDVPIDKVVGIEARGFVFAAPIACRLSAGFVPVRKPGKLPWHVEREEYALEYGIDVLEIHRDAIRPGERILIVDDVLATGGTASAAVRLVEKLGGEIVGCAFFIELGFLEGRQHLGANEVHSVVQY